MLIILETGQKSMSATHVMLTSEQFERLATKDYLDKTLDRRLKGFATKDDLKSFATKDDLKSFATKDDLKNFAKKDDLKSFLTKDDLKVINQRFDGIDQKFVSIDQRFDGVDKKLKDLDDKLDLRFNQLDYKLETSFDDLNARLEGMSKRSDKHERDINELNLFTVDHAMRIKKLEFRTF
jgi:hypothetical protein